MKIYYKLLFSLQHYEIENNTYIPITEHISDDIYIKKYIYSNEEYHIDVIKKKYNDIIYKKYNVCILVNSCNTIYSYYTLSHNKKSLLKNIPKIIKLLGYNKKYIMTPINEIDITNNIHKISDTRFLFNENIIDVLIHDITTDNARIKNISSWYINNEHIASIYADFVSLSDILVYNNYLQIDVYNKYRYILQCVFDYIDTTTNRNMYVYFIHTNKSIERTRFNEYLL